MEKPRRRFKMVLEIEADEEGGSYHQKLKEYIASFPGEEPT